MNIKWFWHFIILRSGMPTGLFSLWTFVKHIAKKYPLICLAEPMACLSLQSASLRCTFKNVSISHSLQLRLAGFWHSILLLYPSYEV